MKDVTKNLRLLLAAASINVLTVCNQYSQNGEE